jgi:hypothetical protein
MILNSFRDLFNWDFGLYSFNHLQDLPSFLLFLISLVKEFVKLNNLIFLYLIYLA